MKLHGMRAAIYARRSTEEHQVESLETQLDNARRFCASRGWTVVSEWTDTASRAEFSPRRRPGFAAVHAAAISGEVEIVVTRDDSRLGGDMLRTATWAQEIVDAGGRIFFYATGEELTLEDETSRLLAVVRGFASESERRKISSRTREHLERKARRGLVAGGMVYGYTNEPAPDGMGKVRAVYPQQAEIVQQIFSWYARGDGLRTIAGRLNRMGVPAPRGVGAWATSALFAILRRPLYIGRIEWGKAHKAYRGGTKVRVAKHSHELVRVDAPHLRIVSAELWDLVRDRIAGRVHRKAPEDQTRQRDPSNKGGRPATYLLSGILRCGQCEGPLTVINGKAGYERIKVYVCARRRARGGTTCGATFRRPVPAVDAAVLAWVQREVLTESIVATVLERVRTRIEERVEATRAEAERLEREVVRLRNDVDRCAELALDAPADARRPFYTLLAERQGALSAAEDRLRGLTTVPGAADLEVRRLERVAQERLQDLRTLTGTATLPLRAFLRALFPDGLKATLVQNPAGNRLRLEGVAVADRVLDIDPMDGKRCETASPAALATLPLLLEVA